MGNDIKQAESRTLGTSLSRRQLVQGLTKLGLFAIAQPFLTLPAWTIGSVREKSLKIYNTHTGESLKKCTFWADGKFNSEALTDLNKIFRDHRSNQEFKMDPQLIHLIHDIWQKTESSEMIHLISGYRSPKSNAQLRQKSCGVAKNSQHVLGKAADIMIPGRTMKQVQKAAKLFKAGGVGRYAHFVHIDTGPVRYWGPA